MPRAFRDVGLQGKALATFIHRDCTAGACHISFTTPFTELPIALVSGTSAGATGPTEGRMVMITNLNTEYMDVQGYFGSGSTHAHFYFMVIGRR